MTQVTQESQKRTQPTQFKSISSIRVLGTGLRPSHVRKLNYLADKLGISVVCNSLVYIH